MFHCHHRLKFESVTLYREKWVDKCMLYSVSMINITSANETATIAANNTIIVSRDIIVIWRPTMTKNNSSLKFLSTTYV